MPKTLTFSEKNNGWTGESPFQPGDMTSLDNRFYSFKGGQLYLHNDKANPVRCNFYGTQYYPRVKTVFNDAPDTDKIFKTLTTEGNAKWSVIVETNFVTSTVKTNEFVTKESREFAYLRQDEDETSTQGGAVQGVGNLIEAVALVMSVASIPDNINIGDALFQMNGAEQELIGIITDYTPTSITVDAINETPIEDTFCFIRKINRIEGAEMRGYYMEVTLELESTSSAELFAISTNAVKSGI
jgi:hypothetical protein